MQLEFLWRDPAVLRTELEARTGQPIDITLTDNSSSIMTFRSARKGEPARLRIHRMFLGAGSDVIDALSTWLSRARSPQSARVLDSFIARNQHLIARGETRRIRLCTRGGVHDLQPHYDELNSDHFGDAITAPVTWGRFPAPKRRRSIRLGSYTPEDNLIRIHPYLDQAFVPDYFVRYIIYHEMLHAHLGIEMGPSGRRRIHTPEFNRLERAYPDYARAIAWHDNSENLRRLLRRPRDVA